MEIKLQNISPKMLRAAIIGGIVLLVVTAAMVLLTPKPGEIPAVSQTAPQNNQEHIIPSNAIIVTFSRDLTEDEQANITFSTQPIATLTPSWVSASTLQLTPIEDLSFAATYDVDILFKGRRIHSFAFSTLDTTVEKFEEEMRQQAEGDELFYQAEAQWYADNPWYPQLPIKGENFEIVFEPTDKRFRVHIQVTARASNYEIQRVKDVALLTLKNTGADLNRYKVAYYIDYQ